MLKWFVYGFCISLFFSAWSYAGQARWTLEIEGGGRSGNIFFQNILDPKEIQKEAPRAEQIVRSSDGKAALLRTLDGELYKADLINAKIDYVDKSVRVGQTIDGESTFLLRKGKIVYFIGPDNRGFYAYNFETEILRSLDIYFDQFIHSNSKWGVLKAQNGWLYLVNAKAGVVSGVLNEFHVAEDFLPVESNAAENTRWVVYRDSSFGLRVIDLASSSHEVLLKNVGKIHSAGGGRYVVFENNARRSKLRVVDLSSGKVSDLGYKTNGKVRIIGNPKDGHYALFRNVTTKKLMVADLSTGRVRETKWVMESATRFLTDHRRIAFFAVDSSGLKQIVLDFIDGQVKVVKDTFGFFCQLALRKLM